MLKNYIIQVLRGYCTELGDFIVSELKLSLFLNTETGINFGLERIENKKGCSNRLKGLTGS